MPLTVLEVIQRVAQRTGLPRPNSAVSNTDPQIIQMVGLLNNMSEDLDTRRRSWFGAFWVIDNTGGQPATRKRLITRDDDTWVIPDPGPLLYLTWKWKSAKGLEYAEDFRTYERWIAAYILSLVDRETIDMAGGTRQYQLRNINQAPWAKVS